MLFEDIIRNGNVYFLNSRCGKNMKKIIITIICVFTLIVLTAPKILGFSIFNLGHAVSVATGMSAKLACSSYFVSGLSKAQIVNNLASYSPVARIVDIQYDEEEYKVSANLYGIAETTAVYNALTGCSLDFGQNTLRQSFNNAVEELDSEKSWPSGKNNGDIEPLIQDKLDEILRADNERGYNTRALAVIHEGRLVAESYANGFNNESKLLGWSMAKSLTSIYIGMLEHKGLLSLYDDNLFSEWQNDERRNIKLIDLLRMSSGLGFDETYAPGSDATHMLFTAESAANVAMDSSLEYEPSTHFSYSSGTTNLIARYIKQVLSEKGIDEVAFLSEQLYKPLDMQHFVFEQDAKGDFVGSSYAYGSARDWARLGQLMLNNGNWNGSQILSSDYVSLAQQPNSSKNEQAYGFQFWLNQGDSELRWPSLPEDAYAMLGNRKQSVMIVPSKDMVLVRLGWSSGDYPMNRNYQQIIAVTDQ